MSNSSHRFFWVTLGLSTASLLLAGGLILSSLPYRNVMALLLGAVGVGILISQLLRTRHQSAQLASALQNLVQGNPDDFSKIGKKNAEIHSLSVLHQRHREAAEFIERLKTESETPNEFQYLIPDEPLGKALVNLKSTLDAFRQEEEKRHWSTQGVAHFADILRDQSGSIEDFSEQIIRELVNYLGANQGGIYVKTEDDGKMWYESTACYAYDKKRHSEQRWAPGQGLVGQCALEREAIILTHVPDQYTYITSGLGESTPTFVVLMPLCWNDEIYGVIELASFTVLADHQIAFLKKVTEGIASSLAMVQTNAHMHQLLQTSQRLAKEFELLSSVVNSTDNSVVITDKLGRIEFVNQGFTKLTGYSIEEVMGRKPGDMLQGPNTDQETVKRIRQQLSEGIPFYEDILNYQKSGESYWVSLMVNPVKNEAGEVEQFISIQVEVTQIKQQTLDYTGKLEAISRSNAIIEFDTQGIIVDANDLFLDVAGYQKADLLQKSYLDLLPKADTESPQTMMMWENLKAGTFFSGEFKQKSKQGKELWLSGTFNPIFDLENNLQKIMMFAQFTTYEKEKQNDLTQTVHAFDEAVQAFDMAPEGKLKKANALFLQRFGYKRREVSQMQLADIVSVDLPDIIAALQNEDSLRLTLTLLAKSGEKILCACSFARINNLEGALSKIAVVALEINPSVVPSTID